MTTLRAILPQLALLVWTAAALWALLVVLLRPERRRDVTTLACAALAIAPAFAAWLFALGLRVQPGEPFLQYVLWLGIACAVMLAAAVPLLRRALAPLLTAPHTPRAEHSWLALALLAIASAVIVLLVTVTPLHENDALEYATIARHIATQRSLADYPALDSAKTGGFYGPWTHPAGFPSILALAGSTSAGFDARLMRVPAAFASIALLGLLLACLRGIGGAIAAGVLIGTPIFIIATANNWVDSVRVAAGFGALAVLAVALGGARAARVGSALAVGIALGLAFFIHSIGVVLVAMAGLFILLFGAGGIVARIGTATLVGVTAVAVVGPDLYANFRNFGAPIADSPPLWRIPELGFRDWMLLARDLYYPGGKLFNGILMGFTQSDFYASSYFVAAAGAVLACWRLGRRYFARLARDPRASFVDSADRERWLILGLTALLFWLGCAITGIVLDVAEFVKNVRYPYTLQPLVALIAGAGLAPLFERRRTT